MKKLVLTTILIGIVISCAPAGYAQQKARNNDDIIKMAQSGATSDQMIMAIPRANEPENWPKFTINSQTIKHLRTNNVPWSVIKVMEWAEEMIVHWEKVNEANAKLSKLQSEKPGECSPATGSGSTVSSGTPTKEQIAALVKRYVDCLGVIGISITTQGKTGFAKLEMRGVLRKGSLGSRDVRVDWSQATATIYQDNNGRWFLEKVQSPSGLDGFQIQEPIN